MEKINKYIVDNYNIQTLFIYYDENNYSKDFTPLHI